MEGIISQQWPNSKSAPLLSSPPSPRWSPARQSTNQTLIVYWHPNQCSSINGTPNGKKINAPLAPGQTRTTLQCESFPRGNFSPKETKPFLLIQTAQGQKTKKRTLLSCTCPQELIRNGNFSREDSLSDNSRICESILGVGCKLPLRGGVLVARLEIGSCKSYRENRAWGKTISYIPLLID